MRFEYILLISCFILPIIYKLGYWQSIFEAQDYSIKKFWRHICSKQGNEALLHFWIFLEAPLLSLSILPLLDPPFEIFLYSIMLYFGILYNIFVLGKVIRKKKVLPKIDATLLGITFLLILDGMLSFLIDERYIYLFLSGALLFMPLYFTLVLFIQKHININFLKYYK